MRREELAEAAALLAGAFAEGTNLSSFVPRARRHERLRRFFTVAGEIDHLPHGVAEVAVGRRGGDELLLAVAWWHPPSPSGPDRAPVPRSWRELSTALAVFGVRRLPAAARSRAASRRARPAEPHGPGRPPSGPRAGTRGAGVAPGHGRKRGFATRADPPAP